MPGRVDLASLLGRSARHITRHYQSGFFIGCDMTTEQQARMAAQIDWATTGEFNADQLDGEAKQAYQQEAEKITRQWDNQEV